MPHSRLVGTLAVHLCCRSPNRIAERRPVNMNFSPMMLEMSIVHPVRFKCLCMTSAARHRMVSPEKTTSATDRPTIQRVRLIPGQYKSTLLNEWIEDSNSIDDLAVLHIFGKHNRAAGALCGVHHQSVPVREAPKAVQIDRGKNVAERGFHDIECCEEFHLSTGIVVIDTILSSGGDEVLLEDLQGNYAGLRLLVFFEKVQGAFLFAGIRAVIRIYKNVGVEECPQRTTSARRSHRG